MPIGKPTKSFWRFVFALLGMIAIVLAVWWFVLKPEKLKEIISPVTMVTEAQFLKKVNQLEHKFRTELLAEKKRARQAEEKDRAQIERLQQRVSALEEKKASVSAVKSPSPTAPSPPKKKKPVKKHSPRKAPKPCDCPSSYWENFWTPRS